MLSKQATARENLIWNTCCLALGQDGITLSRNKESDRRFSSLFFNFGNNHGQLCHMLNAEQAEFKPYLVENKFRCKIVNIFYPSIKTCVLGVQKNRLKRRFF